MATTTSYEENNAKFNQFLPISEADTSDHFALFHTRSRLEMRGFFMLCRRTGVLPGEYGIGA
jgi:hypothetical protein